MELTTISPRVLHIREVIDRDVVQWLDSRQKLITRLLTTNQLQACASLLQDFDKGVDDLLLCRRKKKSLLLTCVVEENNFKNTKMKILLIHRDSLVQCCNLY